MNKTFNHSPFTFHASRFLGGYAEGVTPVPIPNTEVKPLWADGTARAAVWESRSPPGILSQKAPSLLRVMGLLALRAGMPPAAVRLTHPFTVCIMAAK